MISSYLGIGGQYVDGSEVWRSNPLTGRATVLSTACVPLTVLGVPDMRPEAHSFSHQDCMPQGIQVLQMRTLRSKEVGRGVQAPTASEKQYGDWISSFRASNRFPLHRFSIFA